MARFFLRLLCLAPIPILIAAANYTLDPASLFHPATERQVARLLSEGRTLWGVGNVDERKVQRNYIERLRAAPDAIALGSSRIMLLSGAMLGERSFFNHGVSSASVEDLLAIVGLYEQRGLRPRRVIIGVDPWLFNRHNGQDSWMSLSASYRMMTDRVQLDVPSKWWSLEPYGTLPQLLSLRYFQASAKELLRGAAAFRRPQPYAADGIDPVGRTLLPDGSIAYPPGHYISSEAVARVAVEYASAHPVFSLGDFARLDPDFQLAFVRLVEALQREGVQVAFVLTPYHPVAYRMLVENRDYRMLAEAERWLREYAASRQVPVAGSYDATRAGCAAAEFFDGMHAWPSCVGRIAATLPRPGAN